MNLNNKCSSTNACHSKRREWFLPFRVSSSFCYDLLFNLFERGFIHDLRFRFDGFWETNASKRLNSCTVFNWLSRRFVSFFFWRWDHLMHCKAIRINNAQIRFPHRKWRIHGEGFRGRRWRKKTATVLQKSASQRTTCEWDFCYLFKLVTLANEHKEYSFFFNKYFNHPTFTMCALFEKYFDFSHA